MAEDFSKYTKEELIQRINDLKKQLNDEKYGLFFDRKATPEKIVLECINRIPILERILEYDVDNGGNNNIIIEGDNFHALSALLMSNGNEGIFDFVYIDPPYNTGNQDFTFDDKFIDNTDNFRHTKWLNFMEKRLALAKDLLTEDGHIFISIDDNEHANLKLLCDSIFGADNFLTDFIWLNNLKGRQISSGGAVKTYEHILLYSKNSEFSYTFSGNFKELQKEMPLIYKNKTYEVFEDKKGKYVIKNELYNTNSAFNEETRPNLVFNIWYNEDNNDVIITEVDEDDVVDSDYSKIEPHKNSDGEHKFHAWRWSRDKIINEISDLHFEKSGDSYKVYTKIRDIYSTNIKDILTDSTNGNAELSEIIGKGKFSFPKPVKLIKRLIQFVEKKDIIVLDFFAGSGTTGQAVLEANEEDKQNRRFVLITNNEISDKVYIDYLRSTGRLSKKSTMKQFKEFKSTTEAKEFELTNEFLELGICRAVTKKRLSSIITGTAKKGKYSTKGIQSSLRYLKASFIERSLNDDQSKYNLVEHCNDLLCILEDTFVLVKKAKEYYIYKDNSSNKLTAIYFDYYKKDSFIEMTNEIKKLAMKESVVYLFSLNNEIDEHEEKILKENIKTIDIKPVPSKIYEIYKKIVDDLKRDY